MKDNSNYSVGYCKPPEHGKFKPGKSGNPSGRRRKMVEGFTDRLRDELNSTITIHTNGKPQKLLKIDVIAKRAIERAMKGDIRFLKFLAETQGFREAIENPNHRPFNSEEQKLIDDVRREAKKYMSSMKDIQTGD